MSLTDLMSGAGLSIYAEVALVLFLAAFVLVVWRVYAPAMKDHWNAAARLPLDDDGSVPAPTNSRTTHRPLHGE